MNPGWSVAISHDRWEVLRGHLFPGDGDEHGAVLRCGIAHSARGTRLLVREVLLAVDGVDYVEGTRGYRRLTADFVAGALDACAEQGLAYLAVHNHAGCERVAF